MEGSFFRDIFSFFGGELNLFLMLNARICAGRWWGKSDLHGYQRFFDEAGYHEGSF